MQELAAGIIVLLAALYLGAKYLPAAWRRRLVQRLSSGGKQSWLVRWLDTSASCGSGCDSCNTCEQSEPERPPAPADGKHRVIKLRRRH